MTEPGIQQILSWPFFGQGPLPAITIVHAEESLSESSLACPAYSSEGGPQEAALFIAFSAEN